VPHSGLQQRRLRVAADAAALACAGAQGFIKKYVQCYSCGNPETVVKVRKENISLKCKACGAVSDVDARHKLNTYILKNPPEEKVSKAEKKCAALLACLRQRRALCLPSAAAEQAVECVSTGASLARPPYEGRAVWCRCKLQAA
jgi:ribosomal protein S27E